MKLAYAVIIPVYNNESSIALAVESALASAAGTTPGSTTKVPTRYTINRASVKRMRSRNSLMLQIFLRTVKSFITEKCV